MNIFVGLLVIALAINVSIAIPVRDPSDDAEFIDLPKQNPRSRINVKEIDEDDAHPSFPGYGGFGDNVAGNPFLHPLPPLRPWTISFNFDDILQQLKTHLRLFPFPEISSEEIEPPKGTEGNTTTSVVKVVDGRKVEINNTVYTNVDKSGGTLFKFRIINVRPLDESSEEVSESGKTTTITPGNRNPVTSAPNSPANSNEDIDANNDNKNDSDERKESMEDKDPLNNEIQGNPDDLEVKSNKNN